MRNFPAIVVGGPSGVGKGTLLNAVKEKYSNFLAPTVSHTTRPPRAGEVDGVHYHFVSVEMFRTMIENEEFLEHAKFSGHLYGTTFQAIEDVRQTGKVCLLEIELNGMRQLQGNCKVDAKYVFVWPPNFETLRKRLQGRGTDSEEAMQNRLRRAEEEMREMKTMHRDLDLINDDLDSAISKFGEYIEKFFPNDESAAHDSI